jgi:hypothetical protein
MGIRSEHKGGVTVLYLDGEVGIASVGEIRNAILAELDGGYPLVIDISRSVSMDIAGIQLLCASNRAAGGMNDRLRLVRGDTMDYLHGIRFRSGYDPGGRCKESPCLDCLWQNGE